MRAMVRPQDLVPLVPSRIKSSRRLRRQDNDLPVFAYFDARDFYTCCLRAPDRTGNVALTKCAAGAGHRIISPVPTKVPSTLEGALYF
jgi:hypothetical protein